MSADVSHSTSATLNTLRARPSLEWIADLRARYPVERTVDEALTAKLERRLLGPSQPTNVNVLAERVRSFLARRIDGAFEMRALRPLTGGASKEQYVFELDWTCAGERRRAERMVLRMEPGESIVESHRLREFQAVRAVAPHVPVPTCYWLDESGEELGRPAIVCSFVDGVQKPIAGESNVTGVGIQFDEQHRAALAPQMIDYLARIHTFDFEQADLGAFERPALGTSQDIDWQINCWARVWHEDMHEHVPLMTLTEQWLRAHRPRLDRVSLVHGDYRTGNFLFDPTTLRVTAVLDWELAYLGDRHFDFGWLMMPILTTADEQGRPLLVSLFERQALLERYQEISGLTLEPERLHYYTVHAQWRAAVHTLGSALRVASGGRSHHDILLSWFGALGYPLLEGLRQTLQQGLEGLPPVSRAALV